VEQSASASGESPQHFADRVSDTFRSLLPLYDFSADQFIRTTEPRHKAAAQALWTTLVQSGDIYLGAYEGWYSVRDEAFYTEDELVDGVAPTGAPVEWVAESSYFFRLSKYRDAIAEHIEAHPDFIRPVSRRNEVLSFMREGLRDLSVSRTTFAWGIPVPDTPARPDAGHGSPADAGQQVSVAPPAGDGLSHIMYVWLDALTNYLTAVGYPDTSCPTFTKFWPASLHLVGKDILRFHAIYWPAFLLAAGLPLPKKLFAHGWWMNDGQKMSKSIGNVIDPFVLVDRYGSDAVRYFLMNEVAFGSDGDFSDRKLIDCVNAKLANELGNLAYRTLSFTYKHCDEAVPARCGRACERFCCLALRPRLTVSGSLCPAAPAALYPGASPPDTCALPDPSPPVPPPELVCNPLPSPAGGCSPPRTRPSWLSARVCCRRCVGTLRPCRCTDTRRHCRHWRRVATGTSTCRRHGGSRRRTRSECALCCGCCWRLCGTWPSRRNQ
jgi:methionyl-tRNA synthetase